MASCFANNTDQPTCRKGHYAKVLYRGKDMDRVECNHPTCEQNTQTLWGEHRL